MLSQQVQENIQNLRASHGAAQQSLFTITPASGMVIKQQSVANFNSANLKNNAPKMMTSGKSANYSQNMMSGAANSYKF